VPPGCPVLQTNKAKIVISGTCSLTNANNAQTVRTSANDDSSITVPAGATLTMGHSGTSAANTIISNGGTLNFDVGGTLTVNNTAGGSAVDANNPLTINKTGAGSMNVNGGVACSSLNVGGGTVNVSSGGGNDGLYVNSASDVMVTGGAKLNLSGGSLGSVAFYNSSGNYGFTLDTGSAVSLTNQSGTDETHPFTMSSASPAGSKWVLVGTTPAGTSAVSPLAVTVATGATGTVSLYLPVSDITGVPTTAAVGTPLTLTGTVVPANAMDKVIVWSVKSAGTTGATISGNVLSTTAEGTATVTATIANGTAPGVAYTKDFAIAVKAPVTAIRSAQTTFYVVKGKSLTIPYAYDLAAGSASAAPPVFTWTSDNNSSVSVTPAGKVKGLVAGKSAKITVTADNGQSKIFTVKVVKAALKATGVSVSKPPKTMAVGSEKILKVKISPAKATGAVVKFSLDKASKKVVTVDKAGKVTALAKGTARITVKAGGAKTVVTIKVK